ncbi:U6 snRNA-specific terminal uridylyltransferase 1 [Operophtera brumata]|uniref:U6 snRNA-specific terminal uridylyltransferase 1 n=1 Tax=Operophtera brumata TaxID=104452 RepID=A0A0L7LV68_OPEBR|nr:U6 snRNA-specific terminal uridylyltransferase 1 [Operophtera brumata]
MLKAVIAAALLWSVLEARSSPQQASGSFSEQAARLINSIRMPEEQLGAVPTILHELELALRTHWPGCDVIPFGSTVTGLALLGSDIDAYVLLPDRSVPAHGPINYEVAQVLGQFPDYTDIRPSFYYVRCVHVPSQTRIDVHVNNLEGGRNSALLSYLLNLDDRVKILAIIIKYWWNKLHITEFKTVPSYGMSLMVIFYLQQVNMLPPVRALQTNAEHLVYEEWNSGFDEIDFKPRNNDSLYQLMGGFFDFYNDFNFDKHMISPFIGHPVKLKLFEDLGSVPNEFECYRRNVAENIQKPVDLSGELYVQDPFVHNKNLAVSLSAQDSSLFKKELKRIALKYRENNENAFLDQILSVQVSLRIQSAKL